MGRKPKILVVGSIVMDLIVETEIFPQSGETVIGKTFRTAPGGKGANQAVQAARLGADVTMVGKVGCDDFGGRVVQSVADSGVDISNVLKTDRASTAVGSILLETGSDTGTKNRIIVVPGANMAITKEDVSFLTTSIANYDMVVMQLEISMDVIEFVAAVASENSVPVMLNSAPAAPISDELFSYLTYISPNEHEAAVLTGIKLNSNTGDLDFDNIKEAGNRLMKKGVKNVIITLGDKGCAFMNDSEFMHIPCEDMGRAVDPTAAGDSFVGAFCYHYCTYGDTINALKFANQVAAVTVTRMGAQPSLPTIAEVKKLYGM